MNAADSSSLVDTASTQADAMAAAREGGSAKRRYVRSVFEQIAPSYDRLNHLLSLNIDRRWRRRAIAALGWEREPSGLYLDLCAGTLDVADQLARVRGFRGRILALDFAEPMLRAGRAKPPAGIVAPVVADALRIPLADDSAAGALVAFGARNLADLQDGLSEVHRVLAPAARFVILEFTTPPSRIVRAVYHAYFHHLLPAIGGAISGHRSAYRYLPESVAHFPNAVDLAAAMRRAGFVDVSWRSLSLGIAAIHVATKP